MAVITITIPDPVFTRAITGYAYQLGYQDTVLENGNPVPNPETKAAYAKRQLIAYLKNTVGDYEAKIAADAAKLSVNTDIIIT